MTDRLSVTLADVLAARERIGRHVHRTPVLTSSTADEAAEARLFFKCEIFQRVGAFKARGAFSRMMLLTPEERRRGVVAFSSGNHAQAVALAARELGVKATIVMPDDAPALKLAATRGYGAKVQLYKRAEENREEIARKIVEEEGAILVPPFDDDAVIAGQGTLALELLEDVPALDVIVTPCGGGGLLSGVAVAAHGWVSGIRLFGVEPEKGDDMKRSVAQGTPVSIPVPDTIADSLRTTRPAERTLAIIRELVQEIVTVTDAEIVNAMEFLASRMKLVVEPGGAAAFAAVLAGKIPGVAARRVGIVLSGGNVDPALFGKLLARGT
jgi:threo-3-hydroxy-L-aspartate ammonia-lyase